MSENQKHVHVIGVCGVAMAPVAKMFIDLGWRVSGSDKGFYPPISDYLKAIPEIEFYPGFHPEKVGEPDLVVVGNFIGLSNSEFKYIREKGFEYKSYPEVLGEFVVKKNSVVVVGTYGKSTISALLTWILEKASFDPSYMSGGILTNFSDGVRSTNSNWSVLEGDEYPADRQHNRSKFFYYHPRYLLLTSAEWDHMDIFETEQKYIDNFKDLVRNLPVDGLVVVWNEGVHIDEILKEVSCRIIRYSGTSKDDYFISSKSREVNLTNLVIENNKNNFKEEFKTSMIGDHMMENICGAVAMANELGIPTSKIKDAVVTFGGGVRRRLEFRGKTQKGAYVIDDLAHSPAKARAGIKALRGWYENSKIYVVYEPNVGNRTKESLSSYEGAFDYVSEVIVPRLSVVKAQVGQKRLNGSELVGYIAKNGVKATYIDNDDKLIEILKQKINKDDIIVFMGSHGFRGMIENLLE